MGDPFSVDDVMGTSDSTVRVNVPETLSDPDDVCLSIFIFKQQILKVLIALQPKLSVAVTVYVPEQSPEIIGPVSPLLHS